MKRNAHPRDWPRFVGRLGDMPGRLVSTRVRRLFQRRKPQSIAEPDLPSLSPRP